MTFSMSSAASVFAGSEKLVVAPPSTTTEFTVADVPMHCWNMATLDASKGSSS